MRTSHTSDLSGAPSVDISPLPMEDAHITPVEVPSTPPAMPLFVLPLQPLEVMTNAEESIPIVNVDQERQDDDHDRECGKRCGRRHGCREHERVHATPIELMVGHHRHPKRKMKAPSCGTH